MIYDMAWENLQSNDNLSDSLTYQMDVMMHTGCIPTCVDSLSFFMKLFNYTIQHQQTYQPASNSYHYIYKHNTSQVSKKILILVMKNP
jgi:hypothetical protein